MSGLNLLEIISYDTRNLNAVSYLAPFIMLVNISLSSLLITSMGHIKLTDFGLSKVGLMNCE